MEYYIGIGLTLFVIATFIKFLTEPSHEFVDILAKGIIILMICSIWPVSLTILGIFAFAEIVKKLF